MRMLRTVVSVMLVFAEIKSQTTNVCIEERELIYARRRAAGGEEAAAEKETLVKAGRKIVLL